MNNGWGPYGRDSYDPTYGNELFLGGRQSSSNAGQNFLPTHQCLYWRVVTLTQNL
ncbi:Leukotoxin LukD [Staphylococcus aureus]|uniref:Leukotoxin LukD n=1 Tax=Staphylococcus aureus TaxID=1280 RepID=A0A380ELM1_STAAU|nr:Leukotoxin LukD [Staphylococcus aureus]